MKSSFEIAKEKAEINRFCHEVYQLAKERLSKDGYIIALQTLISVEIEQDEDILTCIIRELQKTKISMDIVKKKMEIH